MELNVSICDDNQSDINRLSALLTTCSIQLDIDLNISHFNDGTSLLDSIHPGQPFPYHLVFLDIEMPEDNGLVLAKKLNKLLPSDALLVFVTSYPSYMSESFSVHPFDFLQKPITSAQLSQLLSDIHERFSKRSTLLLNVTKNGVNMSIHADEVIYIESMNAKLQDLILYTENDSYLKRGILSDLEALYPDIFVPANRSTLINLLHVHYVTDDEVIMINGVKIPISIRNRRNLVRLLKSNPTIQH